MAGQPPDPRNLQSREDAFEYPLPVVRRLEQQLRKNIDENRSKLRSLVGASYRDLLGTAERIIEMDGQMQTVETGLSDVGRKCNARAIERVGDNHAGMRKARDAKEHERYRTMAQTKVLQSCLTATSRIIKADGDALLAAKLLVLARLLHKSVMEGANTPAVLGDFRRRLGSLRKKLLSYIERALVKADANRENLAHTLCAYALVSSSAPKDALRHFLQARFEQIESKLETPSESAVLQMLELYKQTLLDTRALFPRLFAEALASISKLPLLHDQQIQAGYELNLDVYGMWIADDVRTFTPWVRHDQLLGSDVQDALSSWSTQAQKCMLQAVKACIASEPAANTVLATRKKVLSQFLALSGNFPNQSMSREIDNVRETFVQRLEELAKSCATSGKSILDGLANLAAQPTHEFVKLWELASEDFDLGSGAVRFRDSVISRRHGRDRRLHMARDQLDAFTRDLDAVWELTQQMRSTKWDSELDLDLDDLPDGEKILEALTKADSERLQSTLRQATTETLRQMYDWVQAKIADGDDPALLVRLLRELDERRKTLIQHMNLSDNNGLDASSVAAVHLRLANSVSTEPLQQYTARWNRPASTLTTLWDGSPALPVQPSPATFKLLTSLQKAMSEAGSDLWSPAAVGIMKEHIDDQLSAGLGDAEPASKGKEGTVNGHVEDTEMTPDSAGDTDGAPMTNGDHAARDQERERSLQRLFDAFYLRRILRHATEGTNGGLQEAVNKLAVKLDLDKASSERLKKGANEYWKRTYLLFGLLAPSMT